VPRDDEPIDRPDPAPRKSQSRPVLTHMSWLPVAFVGFLILAAMGVVLMLPVIDSLFGGPPPVDEVEAGIPTEVVPEPAETSGAEQTSAGGGDVELPPSSDSAAGGPQDDDGESAAAGDAATIDNPHATLDPGDKPDPASNPDVNEQPRDTTDSPEPDTVTDDPLSAETATTEGDEDAHPLIVGITREGYNVWAELKAALDEGAYGDVLRTMRLTPTDTPLGLLPDPTDESLYIPFKSLLAVATQDHPQLLDEMRANFGPVARVRLSAAMADSDAIGVRSVALQFYGTQAAGLAHRWLGDRELSAPCWAVTWASR